MLGPEIVGVGGSALVSYYDATTVLKGCIAVLNGRITHEYRTGEIAKRHLNTENEAYIRLGKHKNVLECFGWVEVQPGVRSLRLEFAPKLDLRRFIGANSADQVEMSLRHTWVTDLAKGFSAYALQERLSLRL